jgi:hypothetical protein
MIKLCDNILYRGRRDFEFVRHLLKAYGIKSRCYWELFEEHVRNLGTLCFDHPSLPQKRGKKKKKKKNLVWKIEAPLSKWKVNNGEFTLHTKHNLKKKTPHSTHKTKKRGPFIP